MDEYDITLSEDEEIDQEEEEFQKKQEEAMLINRTERLWAAVQTFFPTVTIFQFWYSYIVQNTLKEGGLDLG